jgi:hypothetical protein
MLAIPIQQIVWSVLCFDTFDEIVDIVPCLVFWSILLERIFPILPGLPEYLSWKQIKSFFAIADNISYSSKLDIELMMLPILLIVAFNRFKYRIARCSQRQKYRPTSQQPPTKLSLLIDQGNRSFVQIWPMLCEHSPTPKVISS